jgi:hypothetical protein
VLYLYQIRESLWFFHWKLPQERFLDHKLFVEVIQSSYETGRKRACGLFTKKRLILSFTTSLVLLLSTVTNSTTAAVITAPIPETQIVETISNVVLSAPAMIDEPANMEKYVRSYFAKTPLLAQISYCESRFRQYDKKGNVLRGEMVKEDVGLMQINERYHKETAEKLGFDIYTIEGNLGYAKYLYNTQGAAPWSASSPCWSR